MLDICHRDDRNSVVLPCRQSGVPFLPHLLMVISWLSGKRLDMSDDSEVCRSGIRVFMNKFVTERDVVEAEDTIARVTDEPTGEKQIAMPRG